MKKYQIFIEKMEITIECFISNDIFNEKISLFKEIMENPIKYEIEDKVEKIFAGDKEKYLKYIKLINKKGKKIAMLYAHGGTQNSKWIFFDGEKKELMQTWIDKLSKTNKYICLVICVCNPGYHTPKNLKNLLLFIPDDDIDFSGGGGLWTKREVIFTLLSPKEGEIDSSTIDFYLKVGH